MLHRNLLQNIRFMSAIFTLFMNLNPNGEGPHQWNFNSIIYCLRQYVNKHTHILLCPQEMRRTDLTSTLKTLPVITLQLPQGSVAEGPLDHYL